MSKKSFDPIDFALLALAFVGAGAMSGIITVSEFDESLADMAFPNIGHGVSLATLATAAFATNDNADLDSLAVVGSAVGLVVCIFVGTVASFFTKSDR